MKRFKIIVLLLIIGKLLIAQPIHKIFNDYYTKYFYVPIITPELFIDGPIHGDIDSMEITMNDTLIIRISYRGNNVCTLTSDSIRLNYRYRFGRIIQAGNTKIIRLFPFIFAFNNGLQAIYYKGFGKINNAKHVSGLKTMDKTKMRYSFGKLKRTKIYNWNTIAQKCYYKGYSKFSYPNDSSIIERHFEKDDSLANETTYIFDKLGNIKNINALVKKRYIGWGIDVTYYAYNGNEAINTRFEYSFDNYNNWIERRKYNKENLQEKMTRKFYYKTK
jgi:hypothetical protein